jgi:hypothetical protein
MKRIAIAILIAVSIATSAFAGVEALNGVASGINGAGAGYAGNVTASVGNSGGAPPALPYEILFRESGKQDFIGYDSSSVQKIMQFRAMPTSWDGKYNITKQAISPENAMAYELMYHSGKDLFILRGQYRQGFTRRIYYSIYDPKTRNWFLAISDFESLLGRFDDAVKEWAKQYWQATNDSIGQMGAPGGTQSAMAEQMRIDSLDFRKFAPIVLTLPYTSCPESPSIIKGLREFGYDVSAVSTMIPKADTSTPIQYGLSNHYNVRMINVSDAVSASFDRVKTKAAEKKVDCSRALEGFLQGREVADADFCIAIAADIEKSILPLLSNPRAGVDISKNPHFQQWLFKQQKDNGLKTFAANFFTFERNNGDGAIDTGMDARLRNGTIEDFEFKIISKLRDSATAIELQEAMRKPAYVY